jgi:hypothetical protein
MLASPLKEAFFFRPIPILTEGTLYRRSSGSTRPTVGSQGRPYLRSGSQGPLVEIDIKGFIKRYALHMTVLRTQFVPYLRSGLPSTSIGSVLLKPRQGRGG